MAVLGLMFPAVLHFTHSEAQYGKSEVALSRFSSCIMLVAYASYLFFQLKSHRSMYSPIGDVSTNLCKHWKLQKKGYEFIDCTKKPGSLLFDIKWLYLSGTMLC